MEKRLIGRGVLALSERNQHQGFTATAVSMIAGKSMPILRANAKATNPPTAPASTPLIPSDTPTADVI